MDLRNENLKMSDTIGRTDKVLSELLVLVEHPNLSIVDAQTLKHHADDLIDVGTKIKEVIDKRIRGTWNVKGN
jgi:bacterioferritin (cytochrome b1)